MEIGTLTISFVKNNIIISDNDNIPFVEHVFIPLEDWNVVKSYIDSQLIIKSKATDSHE
jgi:hypothetical protein